MCVLSLGMSSVTVCVTIVCDNKALTLYTQHQQLCKHGASTRKRFMPTSSCTNQTLAAKSHCCDSVGDITRRLRQGQ